MGNDLKADKSTQGQLFEHQNFMGRHVEVARTACSVSKSNPLVRLPDAAGMKPKGKHPRLAIGWRFDRSGEK